MSISYPQCLLRKLKGHNSPVLIAKFTVDGKYAMTAGHDKTIRLWNPHKEEKSGEALHIKTYSGVHGYEIKDLALFEDNSKFVSVGGDKAAFLWDVLEGRVVRRFEGHAHHLNACCMAAKDSVLITASYDNSVRAWDLRSRDRAPIQVLEGFADSVTSVTVTDSEIIAGSVDGTVRAFDMRAGEVHVDNMHEPVTCVVLSYDQQCILASCLGGMLQLLEKSSGDRLSHFTGHIQNHYALRACFSNTDAEVISGSEDGRVLIWDLVEGSIVKTLVHHTGPVCSLSFHSNQSLLLTSSYDGEAVLWGPAPTIS